MKLCKDCKYLQLEGHFYRCVHNNSMYRIIKEDFIDGNIESYKYCDPTEMRERIWLFGGCGKRAKFWEPK